VYEYNGQKLWYHKVLLDLLDYLVPVLEENQIPYWLCWGTLLGAVRNGKMIAWDYDIDLGIFHKDFDKIDGLKEKFRCEGYDLAYDRNAQYVRKIRFFSKEYGFDFHIDLDPFEISGDYAFVTCEYAKKCALTDLKELNQVEFEGKMYPCPKNPEQFLTRLLDEEWRTPKVSSGNALYIKWHASDNKDIKAEISKYKGHR